MSEDELEPLVTECPSCRTRFRASEVQLQKARGRVRCGACLTVFNGIHHLVLASDRDAPDPEQAQQALDALLDELSAPPQAAQTEQAQAAPETPPATEAQADLPAAGRSRRTAESKPRRRPAIFAGLEVAPEPQSPEEEAPEEEAPEEEAPVAEVSGSENEQSASQDGDDPYAFQVLDEATTEAREAESEKAPLPAPQQDDVAAAPRDSVVFGEPRIRRPLVWLGIVAGLILLAGQVLWYQFDDWVEDPLWRAVYAPLCAVLGCQLPQQRDTSLLKTRNLAVRSDPQQPGVLLVNTVLVNEAEFAQPFPTLELRFTTLRGLLVAGRRFEPEEYLAGDAEGLELIPPRTPVQIELSIDDPGPDAVNYFLGFR